MRKWPLLLSIAAAGAALLISVVPIVRDLATPKPRVVHYGEAQVGGPFSLVDHENRPITERDFLGQPFIVLFGYVDDPDQTRASLQVLHAALAQLGHKATKLKIVFVTLAPERDPPSRLAQFLAPFGSNFRGLGGSPDAVADMARRYRLFWKRLEPGPTGAIDYQPIYFVMSAKGGYAGHVPYSPSAREVSAALSPLL